MKKKSIILVVLVAVLAVTLITTCIHQYPQFKSEQRLDTVVEKFLNGYSVFYESSQTTRHPEYMEVCYTENMKFFIMFQLSKKDSLHYSTEYGDPEFFTETDDTILDATHSETACITTICKLLQYNTCFLKTEKYVSIAKIRIYENGLMEALDEYGEWHYKLTCHDFVIS